MSFRSTPIVIAVLVAAAVGVGYFALSSASSTKTRLANNTNPAGPTNAEMKSLDQALNTVLDLKRDSKWSQAEAILKEAITKHADEQALYVQLAEVYVGMEKPDDAYANYEKALAIGPREGELEFAAGTAANAAGKLDRAVEHYQSAEVSLKNDHRPPLYLAQVLIKQNKLDEAKVRLRRVQMIKPDEPIGFGSMAEIFLRENLPDLALQHVATARKLQPDYLPWRMVEARALKRNAQPQQALDLLTSLSDAQKLEPGVLSLIGECYGMLQQPAKAATEFSRMADQFPEKGDLCLDAALWLERAGDKAGAKKYAQRAKMLAVAGADEVMNRLDR